MDNSHTTNLISLSPILRQIPSNGRPTDTTSPTKVLEPLDEDIVSTPGPSQPFTPPQTVTLRVIFMAQILPLVHNMISPLQEVLDLIGQVT